jgi:DNA-binding CsgD family transcriptional regulator
MGGCVEVREARDERELRDVLERAGAVAERLADSVRTALSGLDRRELSLRALPEDRFGHLSVREREVFELVLQGLSSKEIARELGVARATARCHIQHVLMKLGVYTRTQAAALAASAGPSDDSAGAAVKLTAGLTLREKQVLGCLAAGLGRAEIAAGLHVSPHTARTHIQRVLAKLGVHSVLGAMAVARSAGVVPLRPEPTAVSW